MTIDFRPSPMRQFFLNLWANLPSISLLILLIFFIIGLPWLNYTRCQQTGEVAGRRTEWHLLTGCYIEVRGRMVPLDSWRGEYDE